MKTFRSKKIRFSPIREQRQETDGCCYICHRPLLNWRIIRVIDGGLYVLHPEDELEYYSSRDEVLNDDLGVFYIGSECARSLGLEWTSVEII